MVTDYLDSTTHLYQMKIDAEYSRADGWLQTTPNQIIMLFNYIK